MRLTCETNFAEIQKFFATTQIQQHYMLREQHKCCLPIFSLPQLGHFLPEHAVWRTV